MSTACIQKARAAALRRPRTTLWRSVLMAGGTVQIGVMRFRLMFTDEEAHELLRAHPHAWLLRLGRDLWSQEVRPGTDEWEEDQ